MSKQQAVFAAISRERANQDRDCTAPFSILEEFRFIRIIANGQAASLRTEELLRIAAIAVRGLEHHGIPSDPDDTDEKEVMP